MSVWNISLIMCNRNPCKMFEITDKMMAVPIKGNSNKFFMESSNQITWFFHTSTTWKNFAIWRQGFLTILFCKPQQRYFDLYLKKKFKKN